MEKLFFESVKEHRKQYYVEYSPPKPNYLFATLSLTFTRKLEKDAVASLMETELEYWLNRYPVPLMVFSFSPTDDLIQINNNSLSGGIIPGHTTIKKFWNNEDLIIFLKIILIN